eukprot:TRINITY_DN13884_c0_g1_i1.p1 TRINITY_DN13884_c0_g1~~TRINITY_DN13884_c0_g1_i1.p1  ORF type:complete len:141 (-),score=32.59 TRINITY_DN13884_c0_g1_i1:18-440(-)
MDSSGNTSSDGKEDNDDAAAPPTDVDSASSTTVSMEGSGVTPLKQLTRRVIEMNQSEFLEFMQTSLLHGEDARVLVGLMVEERREYLKDCITYGSEVASRIFNYKMEHDIPRLTPQQKQELSDGSSNESITSSTAPEPTF